jgi:hypothetical protein
VAFKKPKNNFLLITYFKDSKSLERHKTVEIKVLLKFFACQLKHSDPGGPKHWPQPKKERLKQNRRHLSTNKVR